ncbi:MAG: hypothetical protein JRE40_02415 [Deltaproteobacteria bacterium]|nr:hypothetical protein [Deltaproteobacteria bacterium]
MKPARNKIAYVAGPYRGATEAEVGANIDRTGDIVKALGRLGYTVICPHLNTA